MIAVNVPGASESVTPSSARTAPSPRPKTRTSSSSSTMPRPAARSVALVGDDDGSHWMAPDRVSHDGPSAAEPATWSLLASRGSRNGTRRVSAAGTSGRRGCGGCRPHPAAARASRRPSVTCFRTARSLIASRSPIALVRAPLGDELEHLVLAFGQRARAVPRRGSRAAATRPRVERRAAGGDVAQRAGELVDVGDAVLEQIAEPLRALGEHARRGADSTCWDRITMPIRGCRARISCAARCPRRSASAASGCR